MALARYSLVSLITNNDDNALQWCPVGVDNVGVLSSTYALIFFITAYSQPKQVPICPHICPGTPRCPHICPGMPIDMLSAASRRCRPCTCLPLIFSSEPQSSQAKICIQPLTCFSLELFSCSGNALSKDAIGVQRYHFVKHLAYAAL